MLVRRIPTSENSSSAAWTMSSICVMGGRGRGACRTCAQRSGPAVRPPRDAWASRGGRAWVGWVGSAAADGLDAGWDVVLVECGVALWAVDPQPEQEPSVGRGRHPVRVQRLLCRGLGLDVDRDRSVGLGHESGGVAGDVLGLRWDAADAGPLVERHGAWGVERERPEALRVRDLVLREGE